MCHQGPHKVERCFPARTCPSSVRLWVWIRPQARVGSKESLQDRVRVSEGAIPARLGHLGDQIARTNEVANRERSCLWSRHHSRHTGSAGHQELLFEARVALPSRPRLANAVCARSHRVRGPPDENEITGSRCADRLALASHWRSPAQGGRSTRQCQRRRRHSIRRVCVRT
jgi:hypothetical protein